MKIASPRYLTLQLDLDLTSISQKLPPFGHDLGPQEFALRTGVAKEVFGHDLHVALWVQIDGLENEAAVDRC